MLPISAGRPAQQVCRTRLKFDRRSFPTYVLLTPQPKQARRTQRHANDVFELRPVSMPADPCAGSIFSDKHLLELIAVEVGELCGGYTKLQ